MQSEAVTLSKFFWFLGHSFTGHSRVDLDSDVSIHNAAQNLIYGFCIKALYFAT